MEHFECMNYILFFEYIYELYTIIPFIDYCTQIYHYIAKRGIVNLSKILMKNPLISAKYLSYSKIFLICLNASLAAFYVGYSLVYIGLLKSADFKQAIIKWYGFDQWGWSDSNYKAIIQGSVPIGAIIGALLSSLVIKLFSRRNGFLVTSLLTFIATTILIFVPNAFIFLAMRLIQGICTGIFSAIVPLYINEIVTPDTSNLGSLNQITLAFGQFFCCALSFIVVALFANNQNSAEIIWKILGGFPLITILIQSILFLLIFRYQTVKYLIQNRRIEEAKTISRQLYTQQYSQQLLQQLSIRNSLDIPSEGSLMTQTNKTLKTSKVAIFFAIHIALLQQMSGINAIAVYGKNTLEQALEGHETALIWSTLGLFALSVVASGITVKVMNKKGRKFLIQLGTAVCTICLGLVAVAFLLKKDKSFQDSLLQSSIIIVGMCIYMFFFGLTLGPIVWLYIPEIVEPKIIPFSTMTNLAGAALCIIVFPLISDKKQIKFIPFLFFFVWCLVSLIINQKIMVQTKGKPRQRVFSQFNSKKLC